MDDAWFSDDDLDQLPDTTLLALEQSAISSTQKPVVTTIRPLSQASRAKQAHNASSFHKARTNKNINVPWRPPQRLTQARAPSQEVNEPATQQHSFEDEGENVIDLAEDDAPVEWSQTQRTNQRKVDSGTYLYKQKSALDDETAADAELSSNAVQRDRGTAARAVRRELPGPGETADNGLLYARIAELEAAAEEARQAQARIKQALEVKTGEIGIIRANVEKERKEHDRRIQALQLSHADEAAKHKQEVEAGRKERQKMQTDNRFLRHDLAQEADRNKRLNGSGPTRPPAERDTPRKTRRTGLGDGFDVDEVRPFSPSRSREKGDGFTPHLGAKRKRSAQDSPVPSIALGRQSPLPRQDSMESVQAAATGDVLLLPPAKTEGKRIRFMQKLMHYRPLNGSSTAIETMALHQSPVQDGKTLATILMDALSRPTNLEHDSSPLRVAMVMIQVWVVCLEKQDYTCLKLVVDIIQFVLQFELPSHYDCILGQLVRVSFRTLDMVTMPAVRAHLSAAYAAALDHAAQAQLQEQIDAYQITNLLHHICEASTVSDDAIDTFWRNVGFESIMLTMHKALPMDRVVTGLHILALSITDRSFGALYEDRKQQEQREVDTVYRLTFLFFDIPTAPPKQPSYDEIEIAQLRIVLLELLTDLCENPRGSLLLANHTHFIGQLTRFLDEQIRKLYTLAPSRQQFIPDAEPDQHDLVVQTINMSMRIYDHLLSRHGKHIDLSDKFSNFIGGYHKFLISMTRLAFIDQPTVFEYGIADDVIEAAHGILDAFLTPEDGDAIAQALETPQASKSQSTRRNQHLDAMDTDPPD